MTVKDSVMEDLLKEIASEEALPLVHYIRDKINVSEFKIAEKLNLNVNQVRNILYKLHAYNLVSSVRKKDKKKGWYIYYWTFHQNEADLVIQTLKKQKIEQLKNRLNEESGVHYLICPSGCIRAKFEAAMDYNFKCPECGKLLREEDNRKTIDNLKKRIMELESV